VLRKPQVDITDSLEELIKTFQNVAFMGEMKQRWLEIKKLAGASVLNLASSG